MQLNRLKIESQGNVSSVRVPRKGKIEPKMYESYSAVTFKMFTGTQLPPNSDMWPSGINAEESGISPD